MRSNAAPSIAVVLLVAGCGSDRAAATGQKPSKAPLLREPIAVSLHDGQPMVADLTVALSSEGSASAEVPSDPGVRTSAEQSSSRTVKIRLRGLAPSTHYDVSVRIDLANGEHEVQRVGVDTLAPLPGFVDHFTPTVTGTPSDELRLFDFQRFPQVDDSGLYVIDAQGTTRFYLPVPTKLTETYPVGKVPSAVRLLDDGTLSFVQDHDFWVVDELGEVRVHVTAAALGVTTLHHDAIALPGGTYMAIGLNFRMIDYSDEPGPAKVGGDVIVEFDAAGKKIWSWDSFDHLDPQRRKDSFYDSVADATAPDSPGYDWTHSNAVLYRASDDTVLLSVRHQDWLVLIDHKTGQIVSKLGDEGDYTLTGGRWFYHQHGPEWQPDGSLLLFDNGNVNPNLDDSLERSRAIRLALNDGAMTAGVTWETGGAAYMSPIGGNAYHLRNGNVLVDECFITTDWDAAVGHARIQEFDADATEVWSVEFAGNNAVYRATPIQRLPGEVDVPVRDE